ncbi:MAG: hypothetical protein FE048_01480 [Thermoplasmata archaeon]|nr:MAG: hypothetical protein FE048_01480 [Thermoplasmata archaeon]
MRKMILKGAVCVLISLFLLLPPATGMIEKKENDHKIVYINEHVTRICSLSNTKKWTYMFYACADGCWNPLDEFAKEAQSTTNLDVVVLLDVSGGPTKILYIDTNGKAVELENWREKNTGDASTLRQFIDYCKDNFPAERYLLAIYGHGGAFLGAGCDYTNGWDMLTPDEMQKAISEGGGIDIICFTAPCLMASLECVYELRNCVDVYVASEATSGYVVWEGIISPLCDLLDSSQNISNVEIGERIIKWMSPKTGGGLTMSAMRTDKIDELAEAIDGLARDLSSQPENIIKGAHSKTQQFWENGPYQILDLKDFLINCKGLVNSQLVRQKLVNAMEKLDEVVISECHDDYYSGSNGLSIYFPISGNYYCSFYRDKDYGLDFAQDTFWDEFINILLGYGVPGDLDVRGSLSWSNVEPGKNVVGTFYIRNNGDPVSELNWKIVEWPEWGSSWSFSPSYGYNLKTYDGEVEVKVMVIAPDEDYANFSGQIKVINIDDPDDYEIVTVSLSTFQNVKSTSSPLFYLLEWLMQLLGKEILPTTSIFPR